MLTVAFDLGLRVLLTREAASDDADVGLARRRRDSWFGWRLPPGGARPSAWRLPAFGVVAGRPCARAIAGLAAAGLAYGCVGAIHRASPGRLAAILAIELAGAVALGAGALAIVARPEASSTLLNLATLVEFVADGGGAGALACRGARRSPAAADRSTRRGHSSATRGRSPRADWWRTRRRASRHCSSGGWRARARWRRSALPSASRTSRAARPTRRSARRCPCSPEKCGADGRSMSACDSSGASLVRRAAAACWSPAPAARPRDLRRRIRRLGAAAGARGLGLVPALVNSSREVFLYATGREREALRWGAVALAVQTAGCAAVRSRHLARPVRWPRSPPAKPPSGFRSGWRRAAFRPGRAPAGRYPAQRACRDFLVFGVTHAHRPGQSRRRRAAQEPEELLGALLHADRMERGAGRGGARSVGVVQRFHRDATMVRNGVRYRVSPAGSRGGGAARRHARSRARERADFSGLRLAAPACTGRTDRAIVVQDHGNRLDAEGDAA